MNTNDELDFKQLANDIKQWGQALGFEQLAVADIDVSKAHQRLKAWLAKGHHGSMNYLAENNDKRANPSVLVPGTVRVISARMNYLPANTNSLNVLRDSQKAYISRYALGRDYHKLVRKRLQKLANKITDAVGHFGYRAFADSAPVLEKPLAAKAGLGWMGKHTLILNREAGSWFFLGELFTDLPLPVDPPVSDHCGSCRACLDICPTGAINAPYQLDATRCISYLTIEHKGSIPVELRSKIGNRIFGCDDCQLICPWNKYAKLTQEQDFKPRHHLENSDLVSLFLWEESEFLQKTEGSAIRRAGYLGWLRNIAIALGNAQSSTQVIAALQHRQYHASDLIRECVAWALQQHQ